MAVTVAPPWPPLPAPFSESDPTPPLSSDHAPSHESGSPFPSWHTHDASALASSPSGHDSTFVESVSGPSIPGQYPGVQTEWQSSMSSVNPQVPPAALQPTDTGTIGSSYELDKTQAALPLSLNPVYALDEPLATPVSGPIDNDQVQVQGDSVDATPAIDLDHNMQDADAPDEGYCLSCESRAAQNQNDAGQDDTCVCCHNRVAPDGTLVDPMAHCPTWEVYQGAEPTPPNSREPSPARSVDHDGDIDDDNFTEATSIATGELANIADLTLDGPAWIDDFANKLDIYFREPPISGNDLGLADRKLIFHALVFHAGHANRLRLESCQVCSGL